MPYHHAEVGLHRVCLHPNGVGRCHRTRQDQARRPRRHDQFGARLEPGCRSRPHDHVELRMKREQSRPLQPRPSPTHVLAGALCVALLAPAVALHLVLSILLGRARLAKTRDKGVTECRLVACAVKRRRFPVGANPTRQPLQPEATGAAMEVTKWLKPSDSVSRNTVTARVCRP